MNWILEKLALMLGPKVIARLVAKILLAIGGFLATLEIAPEVIEAFIQAANPVLTILGTLATGVIMAWLGKEKKKTSGE